MKYLVWLVRQRLGESSGNVLRSGSHLFANYCNICLICKTKFARENASAGEMIAQHWLIDVAPHEMGLEVLG